MAYKRYTRSLVLWFSLVLILMTVFSYVLVVQQWYMTSVLLLALLILAVLQVFKKIDTTNHRLTSFFQMILSGDSSLHFPEKALGLRQEDLNRQLNKLASKIHNLEEQRKREESLFQAVVQQLNVGVFLLDSEGRLFLSNPVAQKFLNVRSTADQQQLQERAPYFFRELPKLHKNPKLLIEINYQGESQKWQIKRRQIKLEGQDYGLFLVNNLQAEMENKESEVTEKLMHTLTHEIMNSISPLTSLSETLQLQLSGHDTSKAEVCIPRENFEDMQTSARVIQKRGYGLVEFVKRYALLARLPKLKIERIEAEDLFEELRILMTEELLKSGVKLDLQFAGRNIVFRADKQLLLQVLINLVKNAAEAYETVGTGTVLIKVAKAEGHNYISVCDEAGGIPSDIRNDIFLPFFSTKDKGSGIGLSLSRKIVQAHNGRLYLRNLKDGSEFRVELAD